MFDRRIIELATKEPLTTRHFVGEVVAMAGLVVVIFALARTEPAALSAGAVGAYIGAAYWFTAMLTGWPLHSHCRNTSSTTSAVASIAYTHSVCSKHGPRSAVSGVIDASLSLSRGCHNSCANTRGLHPETHADADGHLRANLVAQQRNNVSIPCVRASPCGHRLAGLRRTKNPPSVGSSPTGGTITAPVGGDESEAGQLLRRARRGVVAAVGGCARQDLPPRSSGRAPLSRPL